MLVLMQGKVNQQTALLIRKQLLDFFFKKITLETTLKTFENAVINWDDFVNKAMAYGKMFDLKQLRQISSKTSKDISQLRDTKSVYSVIE